MKDRRPELSADLPPIAADLQSAATMEFADEGLRRPLNVIAAVVALVLAFPLMVVIGVLVRLTSPGPVFYTQTRIGLNRRFREKGLSPAAKQRACDLGGQPFVIYKFRTMRVDAERDSGAVWATARDPRVTLIGRVLRQTRLDELPQLLNILKGDMNLVGPRPERPGIFSRLADQLEDYPLRQSVRPGITGLAQVSQQYDANLDDVRRKLAFDLEYIRTQGVWTDLLIMLKTVPVILFRKGGW